MTDSRVGREFRIGARRLVKSLHGRSIKRVVRVLVTRWE